MYQLKVIKENEFYDLHTIDIPYVDGDRNIALAKERELFAIARRNKINLKTGQQALGDARDFNIININNKPDVSNINKTRNREKMEKHLRQLPPEQINEHQVTCIKMKRPDGTPYWLYASRVADPIRVAESGIKSGGMALKAVITFYHQSPDKQKTLESHANMFSLEDREIYDYEVRESQVHLSFKPQNAQHMLSAISTYIREFTVPLTHEYKDSEATVYYTYSTNSAS